MDEIEVYFDGGCRGNGNKENIGVYAWQIPCLNFTGSGPAIDTTNNIMELTAAIEALKVLIESGENYKQINMIGDSQYVVTGMKEWINNWRMNNWRTANKKPVKNKDLWLYLLGLEAILQASNNKIIWKHCDGHSDTQGNVYVDKLCNDVMDLYESRIIE